MRSASCERACWIWRGLPRSLSDLASWALSSGLPNQVACQKRNGMSTKRKVSARMIKSQRRLRPGLAGTAGVRSFGKDVSPSGHPTHAKPRVLATSLRAFREEHTVPSVSTLGYVVPSLWDWLLIMLAGLAEVKGASA